MKSKVEEEVAPVVEDVELVSMIAPEGVCDVCVDGFSAKPSKSRVVRVPRSSMDKLIKAGFSKKS